MSTQTKYSHLNSELTLWESSESPIAIHGVNLALTTQDDKINECRLTFQISPELYQRIDTEALFNLKPEIRTPISGKPFQPSIDIQIEASLDPDLLPQLTKHAEDANQATVYLQYLSQEQPNNSLLSPYSWYALEVKQQQENSETGYRTLWAYFKPSNITPNGIDSKQLNEAMLDFTKDLINTEHFAASEDSISQAVEQIITQAFGNVSEITEKAVSETIEKMNTAFAEVTESLSEITEEIASEDNIFAAMVQFFTQENWQFQENPERQSLSLGFQGKNGQYECYAIAREEQQQMVFYSIIPLQAPENKRSAVAEFITRANYGIIIGNFELDFTDGEIRYKTSIDVEGNRLNFDLIQSLVYANVTMMDEYQPGIIAVIENDISALDAIAQIEG
ncbi:MAG: YbjN domain-containing protein [Xenococcaceae cyanobacterium MO_167.B27]|nr:YbjN domain-containing protein [Xenococcaceae cyanobacterium MO_167.B27]